MKQKETLWAEKAGEQLLLITLDSCSVLTVRVYGAFLAPGSQTGRGVLEAVDAGGGMVVFSSGPVGVVSTKVSSTTRNLKVIRK